MQSQILTKLRPEHFNYRNESTHALTALYGILSPKENREPHLEIAKGLELLKSSTLIIDDILDRSPKRNGVPSLYRVVGVEQALLIGEILKSQAVLRVSHAVEKLAPERLARIIELFEETYTKICQGQLEDMELQNRPIEKVKRKHYFEMIKLTSAFFISLPGVMAAILVGKKEEDVGRISSFGLNIGIAYQIRDDILDIVGDQEYIGKAAMADIRAKKKRLPLIEAFMRSNTNDKEMFRKLLSKGSFLSKRDIPFIIDLIIRSRAISHCYQALLSFKQKALNELRYWNDINQKKQLVAFSELLTDFQSLSQKSKERYGLA